ncbi:hypothetical protein ZIOFF_019624 [Zingiber officinale]|uniref:Pectate lyase superfamily protein domain-containing protein n=1 Tax=Zingiber officinale TaxID=94328 RepID=A0A8J5H9X3_ZINOF|nr:hypothetical protein ZIOFF_019624 [Zingiber officinale]
MGQSIRRFHASKIVLFAVLAASFIGNAGCRPNHRRKGGDGWRLVEEVIDYTSSGAGGCRAHVASLTDFGGVGDGVTSNTAAFAAAVSSLSQVACQGGAMLVVPAGRWLTGPFNLTSHFTLFLHRDAIILATQVWSTAPPLFTFLLVFFINLRSFTCCLSTCAARINALCSSGVPLHRESRPFALEAVLISFVGILIKS